MVHQYIHITDKCLFNSKEPMLNIIFFIFLLYILKEMGGKLETMYA